MKQIIIATFIIALIGICAIVFLNNNTITQEVDRRIINLEQQISTISEQLTAVDKSLHTKADKAEITAIVDEVERYTEKVDSMTLDYMALDEILQQMFSDSQIRYMRRAAR